MLIKSCSSTFNATKLVMTYILFATYNIKSFQISLPCLDHAKKIESKALK